MVPGPIAVPGASGHLLFRRDTYLPDAPGPPPSYSILDVATGAELAVGPAFEASLAADGSRVHLVLQGSKCVPSLVTLGSAGQKLTTIRAGLKADDGEFTWSPDGRLVAFWRYLHPPSDICGSQGGAYQEDQLLSAAMVMHADGSGLRTLLANVLRGLGAASLAWSPDGHHLAVTTSATTRDTTGSIVAFDTVSGAKTDLTPALPTLGATSAFYPAWSPDGRLIAFEFATAASNEAGVGTISISDRMARRVGTYGNATNVLPWSPDGKSLAVVRGTGGGVLTLLDPAGTDVSTSLGGPPVNEFARFGWSPDGHWIACESIALDPSSGTYVAGGIVLVALDGSSAPVAIPETTVHHVEFVGWAP